MQLVSALATQLFPKSLRIGCKQFLADIMKSSILKSFDSEGSALSIKALRKTALASLLEEGESDKKALKEAFESCLSSLVEKGKIVEDDGLYSKAVKDKSTKKRKIETVDEPESNTQKKKTPVAATEDEDDELKIKAVKDAASAAAYNSYSAASAASKMDLSKFGEQAWKDGSLDQDYLTKNPDGITRLFCGNLNKKITEEELKGCLEGLTHIKWITDKQTREFYGSTFVEMKDTKAAAIAVQKDKQKFMGRPLKIYYCPPRPGDVWPPDANASGRPGEGNTSAKPRSEKSAKPVGCKKLFAGNLSYNVDDEAMIEFFKDCGTLVGLRWLTHKGSEEFRGCGFMEFATEGEAEAAMKLDGKELLGRPVRLDWTD